MFIISECITEISMHYII